jgi:tRNA G18 (ribose-2'-O)-methylase SpoU
MNITWLPTIEDFMKLKGRYSFVGVDNISGSVPLSLYKFPVNPLFIFGSEGVGITPTTQSMCDAIIHIEQFGSIRSLNVATASGIIMNTFVNKFKKNV